MNKISSQIYEDKKSNDQHFGTEGVGRTPTLLSQRRTRPQLGFVTRHRLGFLFSLDTKAIFSWPPCSLEPEGLPTTEFLKRVVTGESLYHPFTPLTCHRMPTYQLTRLPLLLVSVAGHLLLASTSSHLEHYKCFNN